MRILLLLVIGSSFSLYGQQDGNSQCTLSVAKIAELVNRRQTSAMSQEVMAKAANRVQAWRSLGRAAEVIRELKWLELQLSRNQETRPLVPAELRLAFDQAQRTCGEVANPARALVRCRIRARLIDGAETDHEAGGLFTGSAVILGNLAIGNLDASGSIQFYLAPGEYDITLCLRGGNVGTSLRFSTESPSAVVDLDTGKEIYLQADAMVRDSQLDRLPRNAKSLKISLRDPATDATLKINRGSFEVLLKVGASDVDLTKLFHLDLNGREFVTRDLARLKKEFLGADSSHIVINAEDSLGRQWQSTFRLDLQ